MPNTPSQAQIRVNQVRTDIVAILCQHYREHAGQQAFVSGEEISQRLGITRSSVSNHIKALAELGLDVFCVKGRGYRLSAKLELLDEVKILSLCQHRGDAQVQVDNIVSSTNDLLKQKAQAASAKLSQGSVLLAEAQTQGRGRRGRTWVSPFGASVYMSMLWRFDSGYQAMSGLSLLIGIGLKRALDKVGATGCQLKWPNDVYYDNKKLAGILIEVEGQVGDATTAIIGLGVNIQSSQAHQEIDQAFTSLEAIFASIDGDKARPIDRNIFVATLLDELWQLLLDFQSHGLTAFLDEYKAADLFENKPVRLVSGGFETQGVCRGIDSSGALLLESGGQVKAYFGGEISVRAR